MIFHQSEPRILCYLWQPQFGQLSQISRVTSPQEQEQNIAIQDNLNRRTRCVTDQALNQVIGTTRLSTNRRLPTNNRRLTSHGGPVPKSSQLELESPTL